MIDIIIPVYGALPQTKRCISSIFDNSGNEFRLIIVDDRESDYVSERLNELYGNNTKIVLIKNDNNLGFIKSANIGLNHEIDSYKEDFKIILNSDTYVTKGWLDKFKRCYQSCSQIGIACPASNNAENLSLQIPQGYNVETFNQLLGTQSVKEYPDITTAVGYCMSIKTEIIQELGGFDEIFGLGYGEESDLHYKALCRGYRSVLIPDCFVYHESHASFSEKKLKQVQMNRPIFDSRWKQIYLNELAHYDDIAPVETIENLIDKYKEKQSHDVLFILPTHKTYGGIIVCYELINRLIARGINANAIILERNQADIGMELLFTPYFIDPNLFYDQVPRSKLYIATLYTTIHQGLLAHAQYPESKLSYLIQGYEGWFPQSKLDLVQDSYDVVVEKIAVSEWLQKQVAKTGRTLPKVIPNGIDSDFFVPGKDFESNHTKGKLTLFTMMREDPQNGYKQTYEVLKKLRELRAPIYAIAVGNKAHDSTYGKLFNRRYRSLTRKEILNVYQQSDIFLDTSLVQGFGLMGLEAMSAGVAPVLSKSGGVEEYANSKNSLLVNITDTNQTVEAILKLCEDRTLLKEVKKEARETALKFDWKVAVDKYEKFVKDVIKEDGSNISISDALRFQHKHLMWFDPEKTERQQPTCQAEPGTLLEKLLTTSI